MRNINKYILASTLALGTVFTSCEEEILVPVEDNTEIDAMLAQISALENQVYTYSLENGTVTLANMKLKNTLDSLDNVYWKLRSTQGNHDTKVQYTVNVMSTGNFVEGRVAGISGAKVTVSQGSYIETKDTDGGMAVFTGLEPGAAKVTITSADHSSVEMDVHFFNDGSIAEGDHYNAGTQVLLYPISGKNAATIQGSLFANTSTLNDTLNRKYGTDAVFGAKAGTYLAQPGVYENYNYTQYYTNWYDDKITGNIYYDGYNYTSNPDGSAVQFEKVPASFKLYALARPSSSILVDDQNDYYNYSTDEYIRNPGYITSITYSDLVFEAELKADNTYSVVVPAATGNAFTIEFQTTEVIAEHTRFTAGEWYREANAGQWYWVLGGREEEGSQLQSFSYYNSRDNSRDLYSLNGDGSVVTINPNSKGDVTRRVITEAFRYQIMGSSFGSGSTRSYEPGAVEYNNLYLWPSEKSSESSI